MICIKNGWLLENNELVKKDILIVDGIITKIEENLDCENVIDAKDGFIMNGAVEAEEQVKRGTLICEDGKEVCCEPERSNDRG